MICLLMFYFYKLNKGYLDTQQNNTRVEDQALQFAQK